MKFGEELATAQAYRSLFVLKRAYRFGSVKRQDVIEAFEHQNISEVTATRILNSAVATYPHWLERQERKVTGCRQELPKLIDDADLLASLEQGNAFWQTGLRENELYLSKVNWGCTLPAEEGGLTTLVKAMSLKKFVRFDYVSLYVGAGVKRRTVFPSGLEKQGDFWRLIGEDMDQENFPTKAFLLPRMSNIQVVRKRPRQPVADFMPNQTPQPVKVTFNEQLSEVQKQVVAHQLGIQNQQVLIPPRYRFEFGLTYSDATVSDEVVWPLLTDWSKA